VRRHKKLELEICESISTMWDRIDSKSWNAEDNVAYLLLMLQEKLPLCGRPKEAEVISLLLEEWSEK
jgi:hypothetical protein